MKSLYALLFVALVASALFAAETTSTDKTDITPHYLSDKADQDALKEGVLVIVEEKVEKDAPEEIEIEEDVDDIVLEGDEESEGLKPGAGPAEFMAGLALPLTCLGMGSAIGFYPASYGYTGMSVTPFTTLAGLATGAVVGTIVTPIVLARSVFDTLTLGAFVSEDEEDLLDPEETIESITTTVTAQKLVFPEEFDEEDEDTDEEDTKE